MPTFDWLCKCGHRFEAYVAVSRDTLPCEGCGGEAKRQFSPLRPEQICIPVGLHTCKSDIIDPNYRKSVWAVDKALK